MMRQGSSGGGFMSTGNSRCQDCGNQAKKECVYMRCRTCCKSKGFQCQTHVKSTWVPLYRRRQKQQQQQLLTNTTTIHPQQHLLLHQGHNSSSNPKRLRQINPSSAGLGDDDHYEGQTFPAEVDAMATFHVVRVSSMVNDGDAHDQPHHHDQYAYQTSVSIGGHLFNGILYDQGPDHHNDEIRTDNSSLGAADHHHHHHHHHQISGSLAHPGVLFQHPNFVNFMSSGTGPGSGAATFLTTGINFNACSSSSSSSSSAVATDQRPLFVGPSSSSCPMLHPPSTGFDIAGMQFFPNRKS